MPESPAHAAPEPHKLVTCGVSCYRFLYTSTDIGLTTTVRLEIWGRHQSLDMACRFFMLLASRFSDNIVGPTRAKAFCLAVQSAGKVLA